MKRTQLRILLGTFLWLWLIASPTMAANPPEKTRYTGPWDLPSLRKAPKVTVAKQDGNVISLYYESEPYKGKPTRVFAYLALPKKLTGKAPAMVLVHGGGGTAFREWAELWANRGYVALAMDLAGQGPGRKRLADGGPPQSSDGRFAADKVKDYWSYHAVAAVIRGVSLLANRKEVDAERIGITGISWGGYLTSMVSGLDDRLKVAVPVYGCGFIHENSAWIPIFRKMEKDRYEMWVKNFEPSQYLAQATMPVLFVNGTNDFAYPLDSYQKSYRLVKNRTLCIRVNMRHSHRAGWAPKEIGLFVDHHLREEKPLPDLTFFIRSGDDLQFGYKSETPIKKAEFHFTTDTGPWQKRKWQTIPAKIFKTFVTVKLPKQLPVVFFVNVTDERNAVASSYHFTLKK